MKKRNPSDKDFDDIINKPYEIPPKFLDSLTEQAPEAWMLFYIDSFGSPRIAANFTHQITEMGLRSFASKFLSEISKAEAMNIAETLHQENEEDQEE